MSDPREMFQYLPFPFPDGGFPGNLGAIVQLTVLDGEEPAREVVHAADGSWLIGDGVNDPNPPGASIATHISHAVVRNSSIAALSTMAPGHIATRRTPDEAWVISKHEWTEGPPAQ